MGLKTLYGVLLGALLTAGVGTASAQGLGLAHDTALPLEIAADTLEVAQQDQTAIFAGNVIATQGTLTLRADSLRVYYHNGADAVGGDAARGDAAGGAQGAISRLDAIGNVAMTSPGESANSEWAVYDVDSGVITLGGAVGLTRGDNIIQGARLVVDLNSGLSRIVGSEDGGNGGARVKGLFVPAQSGNKSQGAQP